MNKHENTYIKAEVTLNLTVQTEMLIGSGQGMARTSDAISSTPDNIKSFVKGVGGKPIIPGTSLKGTLRALLETHTDFSSKEIIQLFGENKENSNKVIRKGCLQIGLGYVVGKAVTQVKTQISIDELTGTAKDNHLFTYEKVMPNTTFTCRLKAKLIEKQLWHKFLNVLHGTSLQLGGGGTNNNGKVVSQITAAKVMNSTNLSQWLTTSSKVNSVLDSVVDGYRYLDKTLYTLNDAALTPIANTHFRETNHNATLEFSVTSPDPILISDPQLVLTRNSDMPGERVADNIGVLDANGQPILPASSLRGLLRGQYRRIVRALLQQYNVDEINDDKLDEFCSPIWGSTSQSSAIIITDAHHKGEFSKHEQSFIAIDRFTGGVAKGAMLEVEAYITGEFHMSISWQPRLMQEKFEAQRVVLLMLIRDMMEGELAIGAKKTAGFGRILFSGADKVAALKWDSQFFSERLNVKLNTVDEKLASALIIKNPVQGSQS